VTATRYDGLLTDEVLGRAINELSSIHGDLTTTGDPSLDHAWLVECERRVTNALEDITHVRDCFRKAQK
jgi:hypothetical protein